MEPSESYEVAHYIPAASLPYSQPGSCYTLVRLPEDDPTAGRNACCWKLAFHFDRQTLKKIEQKSLLKALKYYQQIDEAVQGKKTNSNIEKVKPRRRRYAFWAL